jgi:hypothetical protein
VGILDKITGALTSPFRTRKPPVIEDQQQWDRAVALIKAGVKRDLRRQKTKAGENWNGIQGRQIGVFLRWSPGDRERILGSCEAGDLFTLGLFLDALRACGPVYGIMRTRGALLRLSQQWSGDPLLIDWLRGKDPEFDPATYAIKSHGHASDFQRLFPMSELGAVLWDGDLGGIGLGEFVPDRLTGKVRLRHLDIHWLRFDWSIMEWIYQSPWERYVVRPGDGRWFVYAPYGLERPWVRAPWLPCALPAITILDSMLGRLRWQEDLADPLKLILGDKDRAEEDLDGLEQFAAEDWNRASHLLLRVGEDAQLVESSGRGYEAYSDSEKSASDAIKLTLAGQTASTGDGGGWSKDGLQGNVEAAITGLSAEMLAETVNEQGLAWYATARGRAPLVWLKWDTRTAEQKAAEAKLLGEAADGITRINQALAPLKRVLDLEAYEEQIGIKIPTTLLPETASPAGGFETAPTSLDVVTEADEVRENKGLPPWGGERGQETVAEIKDELLDTSAPDGLAFAYASADEIPVYESREVAGLPVVIDRPKGTVQRGVGPDGPWERTFRVPYGYVEGTSSPDGGGLDVYDGGDPSSPYAFAVTQLRQDGSVDEFKLLLDCTNIVRALGILLAHVPAWALGPVEIIAVADLPSWIAQADRALADQQARIGTVRA